MARAQTANIQVKPPVIGCEKKVQKTPTTPEREMQGTKEFGEKRLQCSLGVSVYMAISIAIDSCHNSSRALS